MNHTRLLSSAAALLFAAGTAMAQAPKPPEAAAPAPPAIQNAPPDKIAPSMKAGEKNADTHKAPETSGQGAAAGAAKLSIEQRSKISAIVMKQMVAPTHLTVSVTVGTRVPESVKTYPLPPEVFVVYPEWRGFDYILNGGDILVLDPNTHEIVAIIGA